MPLIKEEYKENILQIIQRNFDNTENAEKSIEDILDKWSKNKEKLYQLFGGQEIISNDKDGILVKENSEIEYIEKLQKLMNNQTLRVKMRNRRFVKLAEYSPSLIASLWSSLLNDIELYA